MATSYPIMTAAEAHGIPLNVAYAYARATDPRNADRRNGYWEQWAMMELLAIAKEAPAAVDLFVAELDPQLAAHPARAELMKSGHRGADR